jgi:hypothetical protein
MKANDYSNNWMRGDHTYVVLVKMENSESDMHADLILSFGDHAFR